MIKEVRDILEELIMCYPRLVDLKRDIIKAYYILECTYEKKGKSLICGNGGSAADAGHIVGELMKGFLKKRQLNQTETESFRMTLGDEYPEIISKLQGALPAISLVSHEALITAYMNDVQADMIFAQQVYGYGEPGKDVLVSMSTSGNSMNVVKAIKVAKAMNIATIAITGQEGKRLTELCDACLCLPENETFKVQELTLPVYHALCAMLEEKFF